MFEPSPPTSDQAGFERIIFFSDGIFAIAITLLALEIRVPPVEDPALLDQAIRDLLPKIAIYALSFVLVASFWLGHHRLFRLIRSYDDRLILLNTLFLMGIAFLPVPSAALGEHGPERPVVIFFAVTYVFIGLTEWAIWWYASSRHRLIRADLSDRVIRYVTYRLLIPVIVFGLSIGIAMFDPLMAMVSWAAVFVAFVALARWFRYVHERAMKAEATVPTDA